MKLGVVGPIASYVLVEDIINKEYNGCDAIPLIYEDYTQAVEIVQKHQSTLDAILFTGPLPYKYVSRYVSPIVPWEFIPETQLSLVLAFFKATHLQHYSLNTISLDSYDKNMVRNAYLEIGFNPEEVIIFRAPYNIFTMEYTDYLVSFHKEMFQCGKVTTCITGIYGVYARLIEDGIPSIMIHISYESTALTVSKLRFLIHERKNINSYKYSALELEYEFKENYLHTNNMVELFRQNSSIEEIIYTFAQKLDAAVIQQSRKSYLLFVEPYSLQLESENFYRIKLLEQILRLPSIESVSLGIGIGDSPLQSKANSELALQCSRSSVTKGSFLVYSNQEIIGPILPQFHEIETVPTNEYLNLVAQKTGISVEMLEKLERVITQYGVNQITSPKLAKLAGLSTRTLNRLLVKLEDAGYITIVGKEQKVGLGRPSRIIKLHLQSTKTNL